MCHRRGCAGLAFAAVLAATRYALNFYKTKDLEYQAFLDHYPVCKYYIDFLHNFTNFGDPKALRMPRLLRLFDWRVRVRGVPDCPEMLDDRTGSDPVTVVSGVDEVVSVIRAARGWATARSDRVLVLMGMSGLTWAAIGETEEVRAAVVAELGRLFCRVYTVGNDAPYGFRTMPLGLGENKVRRTGADTATAAIAAARLDDFAKPFVVLAAFGVMSGTEDYFGGPLRHFKASRASSARAAMLNYSRDPFYSAIPMSTIRRSHQSGQVPKAVSRLMAHKWLNSPAASHVGAVKKVVRPRLWWSELSKYRFLLSPLGDEIQAPKQVEALLVLTIPIIQRGLYRVAGDLQSLGFPMVVVDEWEEVTQGNITRWWAELSPRLPSFRAKCLTTEAFWQIITGKIEFCH